MTIKPFRTKNVYVFSIRTLITALDLKGRFDHIKLSKNGSYNEDDLITVEMLVQEPKA